MDFLELLCLGCKLSSVIFTELLRSKKIYETLTLFIKLAIKCKCAQQVQTLTVVIQKIEKAKTNAKAQVEPCVRDL